MAVLAKAPTAVLEFDPNAFPSVAPDAALGIAVGIARLNTFNDVAEFVSDHPEQKHNALFVDRCMLQSTKVQEFPVHLSGQRIPG